MPRQRTDRHAAFGAYMLELSNAQIAQVLSCTRSAWGKQAPPISELQVQAVRDPQRSR